MNVGETLTQYTRPGNELSLPLSRYTMYITAGMLVSITSVVFGSLIASSGWYWILGISSLILLLVIHPWAYSHALDEKKGVIRAKPFLAFFYFCYMLILPTAGLLYLGYGRAASLGVPISTTINDLSVNYKSYVANSDYFATSDGFIAYNLTKSVVHTLAPHEMSSTDSIYFGLDNPLVDSIYGSLNSTYRNDHISEINLFDPLIPSLLYPGIISQWTIAPIFQSYTECLTSQPPVHVTCLLGNVVLGWAVSTDSSSLCRSALSSNACTEWGIANHKMSIYYPEPFSTQQPVVTTGGLEGIISSAPPGHIVEALKRRYIADGWPFDVDTQNYPNGMPLLFVQYNENVAAEMDTASNQYQVFEYMSLVFLFLVVLAICVPFYLDVRTDLYLQELINAQRSTNIEKAQMEAKREQRRRQIASLSIN